MTRHIDQPVVSAAPDAHRGGLVLTALRVCDPTLRRFRTLEELREHLRWAAARRQGDRTLSAVCRLHATGRWAPATRTLLTESFEDELCRILDGLELWRRPDRLRWLGVAETVLTSVARESVLVGEEQSGRLLMSRTWAQTFYGLQQRADSILLAEAEALAARGVLATRDRWQALSGRNVVDRFAGRFSRPSDALTVAADAGQTGGDFEALCLERGISPFVARRQVAECERMASQHHLDAARHVRVIGPVGSDEDGA
jgi:hypothetical protein